MGSKANKKEAWCPCKHCIRPVADGLEKIVQRWNAVPQKTHPPHEIEFLYKDHDVEFLIAWLKVFISVDFAKDLEEILFGPLRRLGKLSFRADQILSGDMAGTSRSVTYHRNAIHRVLDERYAELQEQHPERPDHDPVLDEIEEPFSEIKQELRSAVRYLRHVYVLLDAKITDAEIRRAKVPTGEEYSKPYTPKELTKIFGVTWPTVKRQLENGIIKHKKLSPKSYRILLGDLPPS